MMQFEVYQFLNDPVLITFLILTVLAILWKFLRMWIVSLISCALIGTVIIIILITIGQVAGAEDLIRQLITSHYIIGGLLTLSFRDILLLLLLIISFQLSIAADTLDFEERFRKRFMSIPKRPNLHYEMENTFESSMRRKQ